MKSKQLKSFSLKSNMLFMTIFLKKHSHGEWIQKRTESNQAPSLQIKNLMWSIKSKRHVFKKSDLNITKNCTTKFQQVAFQLFVYRIVRWFKISSLVSTRLSIRLLVIWLKANKFSFEWMAILWVGSLVVM